MGILPPTASGEHTHTCIHAHIHACMHTHTHTCTHACTHTHTHSHTHTHTQLHTIQPCSSRTHTYNTAQYTHTHIVGVFFCVCKVSPRPRKVMNLSDKAIISLLWKEENAVMHVNFKQDVCQVDGWEY